MHYELAKALSDAGFPQGTTSSDTHYTYVDEKNNPCHGITPNSAYLPTLSELIDACGKEFGALLRVPTGKWQAMGGAIVKSEKYEVQGEYILRFLSETFEEAVAKLWLELNKKS